jgi:Fic family protein
MVNINMGVTGVKHINFKQEKLDFNGSDYEPKYDRKRLTGQILRVYSAIKEGNWLTLNEIAQITGDPQASISAQLRHLRKERFGSYIINKRPRGNRSRGLWEYKIGDN